MPDKPEAQERNEVLEAIIQVFKQFYQPAELAHEADYKFTTDEISEAIAGLGCTNMNGLMKILVTAGYRYIPLADNDELKFVWLLKASTQRESQV